MSRAWLNMESMDSHVSTSHTRYWWLLALSAIGLSALLAILLVVSRTPLLQQWFDLNALFQTALVLHVDFSVLIWLLAFGVCLWSMQLRRVTKSGSIVVSLALALSFSGALLLLLTSLMGGGTPIMSNYIPVLQHPLFFTGLIAFGAGVMLMALRLLGDALPDNMGSATLRASAIVLLLALWVFLITALRLWDSGDAYGPPHYEQLFWGGGHMLQFVYILLLQYGWLRLSNIAEQQNRRWSYATWIALLPALAGAVLALLYSPDSESYRELFTLLMRWGMLLILLPIILNIGQLDLKNPNLLFALLLLLSGIVLGAMIRGDNVMVTAHYHATNGAITLTFMALAYRLFAHASPGHTATLWSTVQLRLYTVAMLLYVSGMAWSGLLNIPRKSPVHLQESAEQMAMGLMGVGGLMAVISTLLFFVLCLRGLAQSKFSNLRGSKFSGSI